ncbi:MAG: oligosaccharide flippase family protein, partial [Halobacteriales archaeon]|nr:oligosaccharide flippase family protein [Halobacteriales archaeon]
IASQWVWVVGSYFAVPYRPRLRIVRAQVPEFVGFGRYMLRSSFASSLVTNLDNMVVSRLLGPVALGLYQVSYRLAHLSVSDLTVAVSSVSLPALAKMQDEPARMKQGFLRALDATASIAIGFAAGLVLLGADFVRLALGPAWASAVPALSLLAIAGVVRTIDQSGRPVLIAAGKPRPNFWLDVTGLAVLGVLLLPFTQAYGVVGAASAVVIAYASVYPMWWRGMRSVLGLRMPEFLARLLPSLAGAAGMALAVAPARYLLGPPGVLGFLGLMALGGLAYLGVHLVFWRRHGSGLWDALHLMRRAVAPARARPLADAPVKEAGP